MEVLVIGGGASGMFAAITAAAQGADVTLYEHNSVLGKKILVTGNGKCNLGNRNLGIDCYNSSDIELLNQYFSQFDEEDTISTMMALGLMIKERNGYLYPVSDQAASVRDLLELQLKAYGVKIYTDTLADGIKKDAHGKFLVHSGGCEKSFDRVILSCGSYAGLRRTERVPGDIDGYSLAYHLGHSIVPVKPALVQVICKEDYFKKISGVRCECLIQLMSNGALIGSEYGELQITETGLSGIPVFQLSRHISANPDRDYDFVIDLMPGMQEEEFILMMQKRILAYQGTLIKEFFLGMLNSKLCDLLMEMAGLDPEDIVDEETENKLITAISLIKCWRVRAKNTKSFEHAQCCSGGVPVSEISDDCQSVKCPGLYITGEMLDVDGKCGGYNLQWAWTTGYIAGKAAGTE